MALLTEYETLTMIAGMDQDGYVLARDSRGMTVRVHCSDIVFAEEI